MSEQKVFGELIRDLRLSKSLSQERLSEITSLDRTYISLIERGQRTPTLTTIIKLSKALGIKPSELLRLFETRIEESGSGELNED